MTHKGKAIPVIVLVAFAFVALLGVVFSKAAHSQDSAGVRGPFMLAAAGDDKLAVWRIDQSSGRVSFCARDTQSADGKYIATRAPSCSAWSAQ